MKVTDINGPVAYATLPTPLTRFARTFVPYQILRFLVINVKMLRMIFKSHAPAPESTPRPPEVPADSRHGSP
jgi:hypothetical protein